ncbi:MAG TPA: translocation/assembly module TamB domain-containing protein, partial [Kofleriaceae bacterium]|nr:translocation/assembly module TamB domain-containing protein [Kofleriaceae bacterium]
KAKYELELADVELKRLAQLPTEWPRHDYVANTLELDLRGKTVPCDGWKSKTAIAQDLGVVGDEIDRLVTTGRIAMQPAPDGTTHYQDTSKRSELHLSGEINGYWDRPYDGTWNLALDAKNLGPTVRSCIKSTAGGDKLNAAITLTGPFVAQPKVGLELHDLDVDVPLRRGEDPLRLTLAEVHGSIDLVNDQGVIEKTKALVRGGREPGEVDISAIFAIKPYSANASIEIIKPIDVTRFLPKAVLPAGHLVAGRMRARGDVDYGFALEDFDISLGQSAADKALRLHKGRIFTDDDFDTIKLEQVAIEAGLNHAVFTGNVSTKTGAVDVWMDGRFPDLDIWLRRFQLPLLFKSAGQANAGGGGGNGGMVHFTGTIDKPKVDILSTELAGVPCLDKLRVTDASYENNVLEIRSLTSEGLGGKLTGNARVRLGGDLPFVERMHLAGTQINIAKLCGLAGIAKGTVETAELDLRGSLDKNRAAMDWLDLLSNVHAHADRVTIYNESYANVSLCINNRDDAQCRAPGGRPNLDADDLQQCDDAKKRSGFCAVATARREAGGTLDATIAKLPAKKPVPARLGGTIALADLPMQLLNRFASKDVSGGLFSTTLHLSGTPNAPQANGVFQFLRIWALNAFLGDPQLAVEPGTVRGIPGVRVKGTAMAGRVAITGSIGTAPPYPVELQLTGRRIEIDPFVDLTTMLGSPDPVQAWVTGTVTLQTELQPADGKPVVADAWIELSELQGVVTHRSADGHQTPLRLSVIDESPQTRAAMSLHVTNRSIDLRTPSGSAARPPFGGLAIELACRDASHPGKTMPCATKVATPAGVLVIQGHANDTEIAISADTTTDHPLELALLAPLIDNQFDELSGYLQVHAAIAGTFDKPTFTAELDIDTAKGGIKLRPQGGDVELAAPSGQIRLANGSLGFNDVQVLIDDPHRPNEQGLLTIHGGIGLDGLTPTSWGLILEGKIAGKMLLVAAPGLVSSASGLAAIGEDGLRLYGRGRRPLVAGTFVFDQQPLQQKRGEAAQAPPSPLAIFPRGVHRELAFVQGSVDIATCAPDSHERDCPHVSGDHRAYLFYINDVDVSVDGEGHLTNIAGPSTGPAVTLVDGVASKAFVTFDADNVPYRTLDRTIDLTLGAKQISLRLENDQSPWEVQGEITVVGGSYKRNFELTDQITQLGVSTPPVKPFWEEYPTIGGARLENIRVNVNRFNIDNNIAQIALVGGLEISGTPRDPRLRGQITVDRGNFRIPGTRADFTRTTGSVDFTENDQAANPALKIQSVAEFRDLQGQDHEITLKITNHLDHLEWDLTTSTGYDKSQTLALLVLGRNPEQLRRSLGDQALGGDPTRFDPSTNPSQGFTDQIVKDLAGDWVSDLLGSSLTKLSGLDVLRIEVGFGSLDIHVEKKVIDNIKLLGDQEWTIRGKTT